MLRFNLSVLWVGVSLYRRGEYANLKKKKDQVELEQDKMQFVELRTLRNLFDGMITGGRGKYLG